MKIRLSDSLKDHIVTKILIESKQFAKFIENTMCFIVTKEETLYTDAKFEIYLIFDFNVYGMLTNVLSINYPIFNIYDIKCEQFNESYDILDAYVSGLEISEIFDNLYIYKLSFNKIIKRNLND